MYLKSAIIETEKFLKDIESIAKRRFKKEGWNFECSAKLDGLFIKGIDVPYYLKMVEFSNEKEWSGIIPYTNLPFFVEEVFKKECPIYEVKDIFIRCEYAHLIYEPSYSSTKAAECIGKDLEMFANTIGNDKNTFVETITNTHKTIQSNVFEICLDILNKISVSNFDARNEWAVKTSRKMLESVKESI